MSDESRNASPGSLARAARRRALWRATKGALATILALAFLALAAGFAAGMWSEVASAPEHYAEVEGEPGQLGRLARRSARFLASFHQTSALQEQARDIARLDENDRPEPVRRPDRPDRRTEPDTPPRTGAGEYDEPDITRPDPPDREEIEDPEIGTLDPGRTAEPAEPDDDRLSDVDLSDNDTDDTGLDPRSREMLDQAHATFRAGWAHYQNTLPEAPDRNRREEATRAVQHFRRAREQYEAVRRRDIPQDMRTRIDQRVALVNSLIARTVKFSQPR